MGWPLVGLRLAALLITLTACVVAYYLFALFTRRNPIAPFFLRMVAAIVGIRLKQHGPAPKRGEKRILLANHVSWMDIPGLAGTSRCAFVAHDGLASIGTLRWLCELNDTVFIARHDRRSVCRQVEQVRTALADTGCLALFPEGTTSDGTDLLAFKSSLLSATDSDSGFDATDVQPVWLDYGPDVAQIAWVGEEPGLTNALRILARWRPVTLTVHFLAPLTAEQRTSRKRGAQAAHDAIRKAIQDAMRDTGPAA